MRTWPRILAGLALAACLVAAPPASRADEHALLHQGIMDPGHLKPTDSALKVRPGDPLPDFSLPALGGGRVTPADFRGRKNLVLSFVPAAWTPICSDQWPGYNLARELFEARDAVVLGVTVDNLPTLHAWTEAMGGLWFPVASDFWPHGALAQRLGILRGDGMSERALIVADKQGVIRWTHVGDINQLPDLGRIMAELDKLSH